MRQHGTKRTCAPLSPNRSGYSPCLAQLELPVRRRPSAMASLTEVNFLKHVVMRCRAQAPEARKVDAITKVDSRNGARKEARYVNDLQAMRNVDAVKALQR